MLRENYANIHPFHQLLRHQSQTELILFLSRLKYLTGPLGFEPRNGETKTRCLTTWRRPIIKFILVHL